MAGIPSQYPFDPTPVSEIQARLMAVRRHMAGSGVDALFLMHKPDIYYFSGTAQDAYLYIDQERDPILFVKRYLPRARKESAIQQIIPIQSVTEIPGLLAGMYQALPKICGIPFDVVPVKDYRFYQSLFDPTRFEDATPVIMACRMIKSAYEIRQIEDAAELSRQTFEFMAGHLMPGISEMVFCAMCETHARRLGHAGKLISRHYRTEVYPYHLLSGKSGGLPGAIDSPVCGTGTANATPYGAGPKPIEKNEPVLADFGTLLNGYHMDETRMLCIGKMPARAYDAAMAAIDILHGVKETAAPDVPVRELFHAAAGRVRKTGLADAFLGLPGLKSRFIGHGVGLELVEPPILTPHSKTLLVPGMILAVEPKFTFKNEFAAGIESVIEITGRGSRFMSLTPNTILYAGT